MKFKVINLNEHPKLRADIAKHLATLKKRRARKTLTPKDVVLAKVLRRESLRTDGSAPFEMNEAVLIATYAIADALKRNNPKFDRHRFILTFRGQA